MFVTVALRANIKFNFRSYAVHNNLSPSLGSHNSWYTPSEIKIGFKAANPKIIPAEKRHQIQAQATCAYLNVLVLVITVFTALILA